MTALKNEAQSHFLANFEVIGYLMKHSFEFIILGEIRSKSLQNFMLIEIQYPNHCHGSDFLCFLFSLYVDYTKAQLAVMKMR